MRKFTSTLQKPVYVFLLLFWVTISKSQTTAQTLKLTDFALWGGSTSANTYNSSQGVTINNTAIIQGNIGSNHLIDIKNNITVTGNIYSGNLISFKDYAKITGNIFANRSGTTLNPAISGGN